MDYNELEYMVLAMVGDGVNSGYAMRLKMQNMKGGRWSAESGSVYRVLRRLHSNNLVYPARKVGVPNRERTEYELTQAGEMLVLKWLSDNPAQQDLEYLIDGLRTRTYFLGMLDSKKRIQTIRNWISQNKMLIQQLQTQAESTDSESDWSDRDSWIRANLLCMAKARQDWLRKMYSHYRHEEKRK